MPRFKPSEKPKTLQFGPFGPRTMKDVYMFIDFSPSVDFKKRDKWLGALLMLARIHAVYEGEAELDILSKIPANVPLLRKYLGKSFAKRSKYSDGSWRNMRSLLFMAMRAAGVKVRQGRRRIPLPQPFEDMIDRLVEADRKIIYPFSRWLVEESVEKPACVTQEVADRYERYLEQFDGRRNRRSAFTDIVRAWRRVRRENPDLRLCELSIISKRDRFVLPWEVFPVYAEVLRMMDAAMHPDPDFPRRRQTINRRTAEHQMAQLRRLLSALVSATGIEPSRLTRLGQLMEPAAARAALRFLAARAKQRQSQHSNTEA